MSRPLSEVSKVLEAKYGLAGNNQGLFKKQRELFWGKGLQYDDELSEMILPFFDIVVEDHIDDYYREKPEHVKQRESRYSMKTLVKAIETVLVK